MSIADPHTEADIQADIINTLIKNNYGVIRHNTIKARTANGALVLAYICYPTKYSDGMADLEVFYANGRSAFLEVKTQRGRQSESQRRFQGWCDYYKVPYRVVRSADEALEFMEGLCRQHSHA